VRVVLPLPRPAALFPLLLRSRPLSVAELDELAWAMAEGQIRRFLGMLQRAGPAMALA